MQDKESSVISQIVHRDFVAKELRRQDLPPANSDGEITQDAVFVNGQVVHVSYRSAPETQK